jgi:ankyrin repeat protein
MKKISILVMGFFVSCGIPQSSSPSRHSPSGRSGKDYLGELTEERENALKELADAIINGEEAKALELIGKKENNELDSPDKKGKTTLCYAAEQGKLNIMQELIKRGVDINKGTPLKLACDNNHDQAVELLLSHDKISIDSDTVDSVLAWALNNSREDLFPDLLTKLEKGKISILIKHNYKEALMNYVKKDSINAKIFQALWTKLESQEHSSILKEALKNGSKAALNLCAEQGPTMFEPIVEFASEGGDSQRLVLLHQEGYDICQCDKHGDTLLHKAAFLKNNSLCSILKAGKAVSTDENYKAWVNKLNNLSSRALHNAIGAKDLDAVKCLVEAGTYLGHPGMLAKEEYVLHKAVDVDIVIVLYLVEKGAGDAPNKDGKYTVAIAREKGHSVMADYLLQIGFEEK